MRSFYLHARKHQLDPRKNEGGFRCYLSCNTDPLLGGYDDPCENYPQEELGFDTNDKHNLNTISPELLIFCAMHEEIMQVIGEANTLLARYVHKQYTEELDKLKKKLEKEKKEIKEHYLENKDKWEND